MANSEGVARTNYFTVRDRPAFEAALSRNAMEDVSVVAGHGDDQGRICLAAEYCESGRFPVVDPGDLVHLGLPCPAVFPPGGRGECSGCGHPEDAHTPVFEDVVDLIAAHLVGGEVAVVTTVSYEKCRWLFGEAVAVNAAGERVRVCLDDVYVAAAGLGPVASTV